MIEDCGICINNNACNNAIITILISFLLNVIFAVGLIFVTISIIFVNYISIGSNIININFDDNIHGLDVLKFNIYYNVFNIYSKYISYNIVECLTFFIINLWIYLVITMSFSEV